MKVIEKLIKDNYTGIEFDYSRGRMSIEFNKLSKKDIEEVFQGDVKENLLNEYKEKKIKLTQFEYDLLSCENFCGFFDTWNVLMTLKEKGHFKNVDKLMRIDDILNNCEVIQ